MYENKRLSLNRIISVLKNSWNRLVVLKATINIQ